MDDEISVPETRISPKKSALLALARGEPVESATGSTRLGANQMANLAIAEAGMKRKEEPTPTFFKPIAGQGALPMEASIPGATETEYAPVAPPEDEYLGYQQGSEAQGIVPGGGKGDIIPIAAEPDEYVIPRDVVLKKGTDFFDNLVTKAKEELKQAPKKPSKVMPQGYQAGGTVDNTLPQAKPPQVNMMPLHRYTMNELRSDTRPATENTPDLDNFTLPMVRRIKAPPPVQQFQFGGVVTPLPDMYKSMINSYLPKAENRLRVGYDAKTTSLPSYRDGGLVDGLTEEERQRRALANPPSVDMNQYSEALRQPEPAPVAPAPVIAPPAPITPQVQTPVEPPRPVVGSNPYISATPRAISFAQSLPESPAVQAYMNPRQNPETMAAKGQALQAENQAIQRFIQPITQGIKEYPNKYWAGRTGDTIPAQETQWIDTAEEVVSALPPPFGTAGVPTGMMTAAARAGAAARGATPEPQGPTALAYQYNQWSPQQQLTDAITRTKLKDLQYVPPEQRPKGYESSQFYSPKKGIWAHGYFDPTHGDINYQSSQFEPFVGSGTLPARKGAGAGAGGTKVAGKKAETAPTLDEYLTGKGFTPEVRETMPGQLWGNVGAIVESGEGPSRGYAKGAQGQGKGENPKPVPQAQTEAIQGNLAGYTKALADTEKEWAKKYPDAARTHYSQPRNIEHEGQIYTPEQWKGKEAEITAGDAQYNMGVLQRTASLPGRVYFDKNGTPHAVENPDAVAAQKAWDLMLKGILTPAQAAHFTGEAKLAEEKARFYPQEAASKIRHEGALAGQAAATAEKTRAEIPFLGEKTAIDKSLPKDYGEQGLEETPEAYIERMKTIRSGWQGQGKVQPPTGITKEQALAEKERRRKEKEKGKL